MYVAREDILISFLVEKPFYNVGRKAYKRGMKNDGRNRWEIGTSVDPVTKRTESQTSQTIAQRPLLNLKSKWAAIDPDSATGSQLVAVSFY